MAIILLIPDDIDLATEHLPNGEWKAIDRNTYDCDCDQDGFFEVCPVGYGKTEAEAIGDLIDSIGEDA